MITLHKLAPQDTALMEQIARWYRHEWHIAPEKTLINLQAIVSSTDQFQLVLFFDDLPVATGGIYNHVGLLDREPRLAVHKHWLALVYTHPAHRGNNFGLTLCRELQKQAQQQGLTTLHLFTDTAEGFYTKLGWKVEQRIITGGRNLIIMQLQLH